MFGDTLFNGFARGRLIPPGEKWIAWKAGLSRVGVGAVVEDSSITLSARELDAVIDGEPIEGAVEERRYWSCGATKGDVRADFARCGYPWRGI